MRGERVRMTGVKAAHMADNLGNVREGHRPSSDLPLFELVVLALGYGLCHAWVVGFLGFAARYDFGAGVFGYDQVYLFGGAVAAAVAACLSGRGGPARLLRGRQPLAVVNLACAAAGLLALSLAVLTNLRPVLVLAFCACGASSALLQVAWGERFSHFEMRMALLSVPIGAMITAVTLMVLPDEALFVCLYVLPFLSLLLLYAHRVGDALVLRLGPADPGASEENVVERPGPSQAGRPRGASLGTFVRLMASIAVFSLVGRCLDSFPAASVDAGVPDFIADNYAFLAILAVGLLLVVFALVFGERFDVMLVYRLSLPVMVAGFAVLTLFMDRFTVMSVAIVTVGYEFFDLLFWALLVGLVHQGSGMSPSLVFGWGVTATYAGMGAGTLLSRAVVPSILAGELDMSALALMCILVLVVLVVLVLPEGVLSKVGAFSRGRDGQEEQHGEAPDTLEARCDAVVARCELTPRESEVLRLLARGRTLAVVARELNIAQGTARTHMMHVYSKLGVHKQQELIDMVEAEGEGSSR